MPDVAEVLYEPDAETLVVRHLDAMLAFPVVGFRRGAPAGAEAQVRKTGGRQLDPAHWSCQVTITCWGRDEFDELGAFDDARRIAHEMQLIELVGAVWSVPCSSVDVVSTPYPDPDPVTGRARYSATYVLNLRGSETV